MVVAKNAKGFVKLSLFPIVIFFCWSTNSHSQEYTLTTSNANIVAAKALIDLPGLTGNPQAIIIVTPLGNTKTLNAHPVGAWYYSGKWNLFNCDFAALAAGLTYKVQYFPTPGINQFLHLVTDQNLGAEGSYIDNPVLNNNPNAQFNILQNHSPDIRRGSQLNPYETTTGYNAASGKWYITNTGRQALQKGAAYNIVISGGVKDNITNNEIIGAVPKTGNTKNEPTIGQIQRWNGTEWVPGNSEWVFAGYNIVNNNPANVGIGIKNPNAPLGFAPVPGKKITLYPGSTGDIGFGVQPNLLQIYSDNPNADIAMGYDQGGIFVEKFRVKANGELAVNGKSGQAGEVLTSNGPGSSPTWQAIGNPTFAFSDSKAIINGEYIEKGNSKILNSLTMSVVLKKKSVVILNGLFQYSTIPSETYEGICSIRIRILVNGIQQNTGWFVTMDKNADQQLYNINNFMFSLNSGTYKIEFIALHNVGDRGLYVRPLYSSIIAYPAE